MTTIAITEELKLTTLKHLANGKDLDLVAQIVKIPRETVLEIGSLHGYPDPKKLGWAADILEKKINAAAAPPERQPEPTPRPARTQTAGAAPPSPSAAPAQAPSTLPPTSVLTKPDEIRVLLNTAKGHPSKRIQAAADKVFDQLDRIRQLIRDDEEKHAAARKAAADREAARAEVDRLKAELAAAQAKLRGKSPAQVPGGRAAAESGQLDQARAKAYAGLLSNDDLEPLGLTSKELRSWALDNNVDCPSAGRLPRRILDAWQAAHEDVA